MVSQNHGISKEAAVDHTDDSSTCSQLRRKRQRVESTTKEDGDRDAGQTSAIEPPNSDINRYKGWVVPESNYWIPVLSSKDDDLTPESFYHKYVRRRRPVVIRGNLPSELELLNAWKTSNEDMIQRAGDETIMVEKRSGNQDSFGKGNEVSMPFGKFLKLIEDGDTLHYLTTQDVEANQDGRPELMSRFMKKLQSDGCSGGESNRINFPLRPTIAGNLVPQNINLWMGNSPTGASSGLHHDYHDNLYIVLRGTKKFRLFSPSDTERMYTRGKLTRVHPNGRINYEGEPTTAYGADPASYAAALASRAKEEAEERLAAAEKAVEEGKPGAEKELELAETQLDEAMEAILDAETGGENEEDGEDDDDAFCLETAREEDVEGIDVDHLSSESEDEEEGNVDFGATENSEGDGPRVVDKTVKNPNNFSRVEPSVLNDPKHLLAEFPDMLNANTAFCECTSGDMLYLPASWFHEVTSSSSSSSSDGNKGGATAAKGHMAFNYWFHPPDAENDFENPYSTDFWPNDFRNRST